MNIFPKGSEYTEDIISFTGHTTKKKKSKEASHENVSDIRFLTAHNVGQHFPILVNSLYAHNSDCCHPLERFPTKNPNPTNQIQSQNLSRSCLPLPVPSPHHISLSQAKAPQSCRATEVMDWLN